MIRAHARVQFLKKKVAVQLVREAVRMARSTPERFGLVGDSTMLAVLARRAASFLLERTADEKRLTRDEAALRRFPRLLTNVLRCIRLRTQSCKTDSR
jgi:hypothetical protein